MSGLRSARIWRWILAAFIAVNVVFGVLNAIDGRWTWILSLFSAACCIFSLRRLTPS